MKSLRIEPVSGSVFFVDIVCDCGCNGQKNKMTKETSYKHAVALGGFDVNLSCECGKVFRIHPQETHFHVTSE